MRILFVTEQFPYPLDSGGNVRTYHILRQLAKKHEVILAACAKPGLSSSDYDRLKPYCSRIKIFPPISRGTLRQGYYLIESIAGSRPYPVNRNYSRQMLHWLQKKAGEVDVIHFNHLDAACYAENLSGVFVFDTHNLISGIYQKMRDGETNPLKRWFLGIGQDKTLRYETKIIQCMALCLTCSDKEKTAVEKLVPGIEVKTIPNGVDTSFYSPDPQRRFEAIDRNLIFVGAMDYLPNYDGIRFFCEEVFGILRANMPGINLTVVGGARPDTMNWLKRQNIAAAGFVEDIRERVCQADLMVVPIRTGGGTRIKILEGMAMGIPILSTKIGAEGIEAVHKKSIYITDTPQEMVDGIIEVLKNTTLRKDLTENARKLVEKEYDWNRSGEKLLAAYSSTH